MSFDWQRLLDLAPLALAKPGSIEGTSMLQGWLSSQQQMQQEQRQRALDASLEANRQSEIKNREADNARADAMARVARIQAFYNEAPKFAAQAEATAENPVSANLGLAKQLTGLAQQLGVEPSQGMAFVPNMTEVVKLKRQRQAKALYDQAAQTYAPKDEKGNITDFGWETSTKLPTSQFGVVTPAELRQVFAPATTSSGQAAVPPTTRPAGALGSFEDFITKQYGRTPTPTQILQGRKAWEEAGAKMPPLSAADTASIKPGTPAFKTAQDLAYGRLTFQGFRTLLAYNRDANFKIALYAKAGELNPNFNPAAFEMGFKLASDPQTQKQLASMDNAITAAPALIEASDKAARSGATVVNRYTTPIKIGIGDKRFSNLRTAQLAFADELSGALGFGTATDMKLQLGVDMTDPNLSPENLASAINTIVLPFIDRKRVTLLNQMGTYGTGQFNPAANAKRGSEPPPNLSPDDAAILRLLEQRRPR